MSLAYTLLLQRIIARAESQGYEIYLGALHEYHPGRPSLACDLMEPIRPQMDRWVVEICSRQRVVPEKFIVDSETGGLRLHPSVLPKIILFWENHWQEAQIHRQVIASLDRLKTFIHEYAPHPNACPDKKADQSGEIAASN
ncbi:MAG: hypothetical protein KatS3mg113_0634 [Planctomycetaceae bacterium]|nr:MAG: hypothetical protein KatS3mg113_0634 [Planctomycetaceae bacterium]